jgi:hypothetical protein
MNTIQVASGYQFEELRAELARIRVDGMPPTTLYNWLRRLKIIPGRDGLYSQEDLEMLKDLVRFLRNCRNIAKFEKAYFGG